MAETNVQATAITPTPSPAPAQTPAQAPAQPVAKATEQAEQTPDLSKELEAARARIAEFEASQAEAERQKAIEQGDLKKLLDSEQAKYQETLKAREDQIRAYQQTIADQHREAMIKESAADLMMSEHAWLGELILEKRIGVTVDANGKPKPIFYDADKNKVNMTLDKLKEDLRGDKRLEKFLKGIPTGSGANEAPKEQPTMANQFAQQNTPFQQQPLQLQRTGQTGILGADPKSVINWIDKSTRR